MCYIKRYLLAGLLLGCTSFSAQDSLPTTTQKTRICEYGFHVGIFYDDYLEASLDDFRRLTPGSTLLLHDFEIDRYNQPAGRGAHLTYSGFIGIQPGKPVSPYRYYQPVIDLGFVYLEESGHSLYLFESDTIRSDTMTNSQNGQSYFIDTISSKRYNMNYQWKQIRIDAALIFRLIKVKRLTATMGIGLNVGISFNQRTWISYRTKEYISWDYLNQGGWEYSDSSKILSKPDPVIESYSNKTNFGCMAYLPLGIDYSFGIKQPAFRGLHLYYKLYPGINFRYIPESGTFLTMSIIHGPGFRIAW